jgi:hypothetical protein
LSHLDIFGSLAAVSILKSLCKVTPRGATLYTPMHFLWENGKNN